LRALQAGKSSHHTLLFPTNFQPFKAILLLVKLSDIAGKLIERIAMIRHDGVSAPWRSRVPRSLAGGLTAF